jgi:anti-sigma regulatory factor (Ser/Thr protein kinase)
VCKTAETAVSCTPAAVAWARRWVLAELTDLYQEVGEVSPDIELVVSELVTNALRAECSRVSVAVEAHHTYLRIATSDDAPGTPVLQPLTPDQNHGRGLHLVDAVSLRWGFEVENEGKTVWADLALSGQVGPTFDCPT